METSQPAGKYPLCVLKFNTFYSLTCFRYVIPIKLQFKFGLQNFYQVHKIKASMNEEKCCQCLQPFNAERSPRMMSSCLHNICSECLNDIFLSKEKYITCSFCSNVQCLQEATSKSFSKNIRLLQQIKSKSPQPAPVSSSDSLEDLLLKAELMQQKQKEREQLCLVHKKPLEIICLTDKIQICSHCAIFGQHKDHKFNTADQFEKQVAKKEISLNFLIQRKKVRFAHIQDIDRNLTEETYSQEIQEKIYVKKDLLINDVQEKFKNLINEIKRIESEVNKNLFDMFEEATNQSQILPQHFELLNKEFKKWETKCQQKMMEMKMAERTSEKIKIYYESFVKMEKQGNQYIETLQLKVQQKIHMAEKILSSIKIESNSIPDKTLKNFVRISNAHKTEMQTPKSQKSPLHSSKNNKSEENNSKQVINILNTSITSLNLSAKKLNSSMDHSNFFLNLNKSSILGKSKSNGKNFSRMVSPSRTRNADKGKVKERIKDPQLIIKNFIEKNEGQTLDFTDCGIDDEKLLEALEEVAKSNKKLRGLKVAKNRLTNNGIIRAIPYLTNTTNLNLSENNLTQQVLGHFVEKKERIMNLRIMNLWHNKMNERKAKSWVEELKKRGIIVTL